MVFREFNYRIWNYDRLLYILNFRNLYPQFLRYIPQRVEWQRLSYPDMGRGKVIGLLYLINCKMAEINALGITVCNLAFSKQDCPQCEIDCRMHFLWKFQWGYC